MRHFKLISVLLFTLSGCYFVYSIVKIERDIITSTALANSKKYIQVIESFRTVYTEEVVFPMAAEGVNISYNYKVKENTLPLPLPATLTIKLGQEISSKSNNKFNVKLYSKYPFPWRKNREALSEFEQKALNSISTVSPEYFEIY